MGGSLPHSIARSAAQSGDADVGKLGVKAIVAERAQLSGPLAVHTAWEAEVG